MYLNEQSRMTALICPWSKIKPPILTKYYYYCCCCYYYCRY